MQWDVAGMARQAGSATLNPHGPAESASPDLLHLGRTGADGDQPLKKGVASPADGVRGLWAEVRRHWVGATLPT